MRVIKPVPITDAEFVSSSVAESDAPVWSGATTYGLGNLVILESTHRIYRSLANANTNNIPSDAASAWWLDTGPTNRWACLDTGVSTQTVGGSTLTVVLAPGAIDGVGLVNLSAQTASLSLSSGGEVVYAREVSLVRDLVRKDWYGYFFEPVITLQNAVFFDVPPYPDGIVTITLTEASAVKVGVVAVGMTSVLGWAQHGVKVKIVDYSRKEIDDFGNAVLVKRGYRTELSVPLMIPADEADGAYQVLAGLRSTPSVWAASKRFDCSTVFGFYGDFELDLASADYSYTTIQVLGLL